MYQYSTLGDQPVGSVLVLISNYLGLEGLMTYIRPWGRLLGERSRSRIGRLGCGLVIGAIALLERDAHRLDAVNRRCGFKPPVFSLIR
jgi:hypothetical protein